MKGGKIKIMEVKNVFLYSRREAWEYVNSVGRKPEELDLSVVFVG